MFKRKPKRKKLEHIFDVFKDPSREVLDLRGVKTHQRNTWSWVWWLGEKRRWLLFLTPVFIVVILSIGFVSSARIATFYPTACLGAWENPDRAQGKPESDGLGGISENNSAQAGSGNSELFCGNFVGEIPSESMVKSVSVRLALFVGEDTPSTPIMSVIENISDGMSGGSSGAETPNEPDDEIKDEEENELPYK